MPMVLKNELPELFLKKTALLISINSTVTFYRPLTAVNRLTKQNYALVSIIRFMSVM